MSRYFQRSAPQNTNVRRSSTTQQPLWDDLKYFTRHNLHQKWERGENVNRFLEEKYDSFIRNYLEEHGLDTGWIPEDMTVEYDPSREKTKGGSAIHYGPQHVIIGGPRRPPEESPPLTSPGGEEYIHEFGGNYFEGMEDSARLEVEEVISKQWQLFCEEGLYDQAKRRDFLGDVESWYNESDHYLPNAGTRIRDMTEDYLRSFDSGDLTEEEHIGYLLSNPDRVADDYLNRYSTASTRRSPEQPRHPR